ncbi:MAG: hypothetical protein ACXQTG_05890 [Methanoculleaceae archaeon]
MGKICRPFMVVECESGCGYSRIYNDPKREEVDRIGEQGFCPKCGSRLVKKVF